MQSSLQNFFNGLAAESSNFLSCSKVLETFDCSSYNVARVVCAESLSSDIANTYCLENCTNCAAGENTGTRSSWLEENTTCTELADDLVWDCCTLCSNLDEVLLSILDTLADSVRNFTGLTDAETYDAVTVAYDDESSELENTTALNSLGNTVDSNYVLLKI